MTDAVVVYYDMVASFTAWQLFRNYEVLEEVSVHQLIHTLLYRALYHCIVVYRYKITISSIFLHHYNILSVIHGCIVEKIQYAYH